MLRTNLVFSALLLLPLPILAQTVAGAKPESNPMAPELMSQIKAVAGANAIDCGTVRSDGNPLEVSGCVIDAFRGRKPFYIAYWMWSIEPAAQALAGDKTGRVYVFHYDSMGSDWRPTADETVTSNHHLIYKPCREPVELVLSRQGYLSCAGLPDYLMINGTRVCAPEPLHTPVFGLLQQAGTIEAELIVDKDGGVYDIKVADSDFTPERTETAVAAIRTWRFEPALIGGRQVAVRVAAKLSSDGTTQRVTFPELATGHLSAATKTRTVCAATKTRIVRP